MQIDINVKYLIALIIFVFFPFFIYLIFSIYFLSKKNRYKKKYNNLEETKIPKRLNFIVCISYLYIVLNVTTGVFSAYMMFASIDELKKTSVSVCPTDSEFGCSGRLLSRQKILDLGNVLSRV